MCFMAVIPFKKAELCLKINLSSLLFLLFCGLVVVVVVVFSQHFLIISWGIDQYPVTQCFYL